MGATVTTVSGRAGAEQASRRWGDATAGRPAPRLV